jgi:isoquinoline 1-oxidoreductase subunit alpha
MSIRLNVNRKSFVLDVDPQTPLLWVLRDHLQLTGTKFGCGQGLCGACTVHVDGIPTRSCVTAISSVQAQRITTIEGLSSEGEHPAQKAWIQEDVPQCGYCQAGQIMTAAWLLKYKSHPTDEEIDQAMSGNICRCATYIRIRRAIHRAAQS